MKLSAFLTIVLFLCCSIMLAVPDATEAARLGGGSSFGSKPFMSTPAPRPTMRQDAPQAPRSSMNQPQAAPQASRPGMFGGMGGLFGGLLAAESYVVRKGQRIQSFTVKVFDGTGELIAQCMASGYQTDILLPD